MDWNQMTLISSGKSKDFLEIAGLHWELQFQQGVQKIYKVAVHVSQQIINLQESIQKSLEPLQLKEEENYNR